MTQDYMTPSQRSQFGGGGGGGHSLTFLACHAPLPPPGHPPTCRVHSHTTCCCCLDLLTSSHHTTTLHCITLYFTTPNYTTVQSTQLHHNTILLGRTERYSVNSQVTTSSMKPSSICSHHTSYKSTQSYLYHHLTSNISLRDVTLIPHQVKRLTT